MINLHWSDFGFFSNEYLLVLTFWWLDKPWQQGLQHSLSQSLARIISVNATKLNTNQMQKLIHLLKTHAAFLRLFLSPICSFSTTTLLAALESTTVYTFTCIQNCSKQLHQTARSLLNSTKAKLAIAILHGAKRLQMNFQYSTSL